MKTNQFLKTQMTHVFYTFGDNEAKLYINGKLVKNIKIQGNLSNWNNNYLFFIKSQKTLTKKIFLLSNETQVISSFL